MEPEDELDPGQDVATVESREMWEQKLDESPRAYSAFAMYRDSEKRSLKAIASALNCNVQNIFWFSTRHAWKLRCDAYDLHVDREQRAEFARNRVRMRERHRSLAQAMGNIAAHGLREWQRKIAAGAELNLQPEQITLLVKASAELESRTLGIDDGHQATQINILFGSHRYPDEKAGASGEPDGEVEFRTMEQLEAEEYSRLSESERAAWRGWKDVPKLLKGTDEDDPQVN